MQSHFRKQHQHSPFPDLRHCADFGVSITLYGLGVSLAKTPETCLAIQTWGQSRNEWLRKVRTI